MGSVRILSGATAAATNGCCRRIHILILILIVVVVAAAALWLLLLLLLQCAAVQVLQNRSSCKAEVVRLALHALRLETSLSELQPLFFLLNSKYRDAIEHVPLSLFSVGLQQSGDRTAADVPAAAPAVAGGARQASAAAGRAVFAAESTAAAAAAGTISGRATIPLELLLQSIGSQTVLTERDVVLGVFYPFVRQASLDITQFKLNTYSKYKEYIGLLYVYGSPTLYIYISAVYDAAIQHGLKHFTAGCVFSCIGDCGDHRGRRAQRGPPEALPSLSWGPPHLKDGQDEQRHAVHSLCCCRVYSNTADVADPSSQGAAGLSLRLLRIL